MQPDGKQQCFVSVTTHETLKYGCTSVDVLGKTQEAHVQEIINIQQKHMTRSNYLKLSVLERLVGRIRIV